MALLTRTPGILTNMEDMFRNGSFECTIKLCSENPEIPLDHIFTCGDFKVHVSFQFLCMIYFQCIQRVNIQKFLSESSSTRA
jgi:hypothetical protein